MIVCADDYGLSDGVNDAILALAEHQKLSAVSCLVALERCSSEVVAPLKRLDVDLGLHLCLTTDERLPLATGISSSGGVPAPFRRLLATSLARRLPHHELINHIRSQYELFERKLGRAPDFIDGHLYVHQLPGLRDALVKFILSLEEHSRPYVRNTALSILELRQRGLPTAKAALIALFGKSMFRRLRKAGLPTNDGFAGIYDFREAARYREYLPGFVACLPNPTGLLVVHPGHDQDWRAKEFSALSDFEFPSGPARFARLYRSTRAMPLPK